MKLSKDSVKNLESILAVCNILDIQSFIISEGLIRGVNESKTCALISDQAVPEISQSLGISRMGSLLSRISLFKNKDDVAIDAAESNRNEISSLTITSGRNKVQFRCTSSVLIKAPKVINDEELATLTFSKEEVDMILGAIKVMGTKKLVLAVRSGGLVTVEASDSSNDQFKTELESKAKIEDGATSVTYYDTGIFDSVFRNLVKDADHAVIKLGVNGTIRATLGNHAVTILPQVGEEDE